MTKKLYVGNLPFSATEGEIRDAFAQYGTVKSATLIVDRDTQRSKGFAFIEMESEDDANSAKSALNGTDFGGRNMVVNEARERQPRSGSGRGYSKNYNRY